MKDLIEEWERSAEKYQSLGRKALDPIRQEGLLCRSEVYSYCADKLRRRLLQPVIEADAEKPAIDMCCCPVMASQACPIHG